MIQSSFAIPKMQTMHNQGNDSFCVKLEDSEIHKIMKQCKYRLWWWIEIMNYCNGSFNWLFNDRLLLNENGKLCSLSWNHYQCIVARYIFWDRPESAKSSIQMVHCGLSTIALALVCIEKLRIKMCMPRNRDCSSFVIHRNNKLWWVFHCPNWV